MKSGAFKPGSACTAPPSRRTQRLIRGLMSNPAAVFFVPQLTMAHPAPEGLPPGGLRESFAHGGSPARAVAAQGYEYALQGVVRQVRQYWQRRCPLGMSRARDTRHLGPPRPLKRSSHACALYRLSTVAPAPSAETHRVNRKPQNLNHRVNRDMMNGRGLGFRV